MKAVVPFIIIVLFAAWGRAQNPDKFFVTYGSSGDDIGYSTKETYDGSYIIAGSTSGGSIGGTDVLLLKVDRFGNPIWQRYIGGIRNEVAKSLIQLPDSGFAMCGFTNSFGNGGYDAYVVRTDKFGSVLWEASVGDADWDFGNSIALGSDNNLYICGYSESSAFGKKDGLIAKLSLSGQTIWTKHFGSNEDDELKSVINMKDGSIGCAGYSKGRDTLSNGYFIKLNTNGDTVLIKEIDGGFIDRFNDLFEGPNGDLYMCGAKTFSSNAKTCAYFYRCNSNMKTLKDTFFTRNSGYDEFVSGAITKKSDVIDVYIQSVPFNGYKRQADVYVTFNDGIFIVGNASGGLQDEYVYEVESTSDHGFIIVGSSTSFGSIQNDVYFVKLDSTIVHYTSIVGVQTYTLGQAPSLNIVSHNGQLAASCSEPIESISIFDIGGQLIRFYENIKSPVSNIDTHNLPRQVLIISVTTTSGITQKFKIALISP